MSFKSYIPSRYNTFFFIIGFFIWVIFSFKWLLVFTSLYLVAYLILRRDSNFFRDDPTITSGVVFAPCNGKVIHIEEKVNHSFYGEDLIEVQICIPWWKEMGIFLPLSSEVKDLRIFKGKSFYRYGFYALKAGIANYSGLGIIFGIKDIQYGLSLIRCPLGLWPEVTVMPGDRGTRRVNFGFLPFGGTLLLYLPKRFEVLIKVDDVIAAKETIVAVLPEKNEN